MNAENVKILADGIKEYFSQYELEDLCRRLDINIEYSGTSPNLRRLAGDVLGYPRTDPTRRFLKTVLGELIEKCNEQVQNATREDNLYHQQMSLQLRQLNQSLKLDKPSETTPPKVVSTPVASQRLGIVGFFSQAQTAVTLVDAEVGAGTLDCLRKVDHPIRLLTEDPPGGFDQNFIRALTFFRERGKTIELRILKSMHDCIVLFNRRCWLFPCSVKDAAKATINMIEIIDIRDAIAQNVENNWRQAELLIIG
jgi:hypothetical protein